MISSVGIAVFVKTPGLSPIKTRLGQSIGETAAIEFYTLACSCWLRSVEIFKMRNVLSARGYWAVFEEQGVWSDLDIVYQGPGDLGAKIHRVYHELLSRHDLAIVVAADSPQILNSELENWIGLARNRDFLFGPALDGGFYLFGGKRQVPEERLLAVEYESENTGAQFLAELLRTGSTEILPAKTDVDFVWDLFVLKGELEKSLTLLNEYQRLLLNWLNTHASCRQKAFPEPGTYVGR